MRIETLYVINYKSCRKLKIELDANSPNILIGLNDCGKTTILKALDLLLGEKAAYSYKDEGQNKSDLSNSPLEIDEFNAHLQSESIPLFDYSPAQTVVIGKLKYDNRELETWKELSLSNTLLWALETSINNEVWIAKTYSSLGNQFLIGTTDTVESQRLWELGSTDLNKYLKDNKVSDEDIKNENGKGRFSNLERIRAGYNKKNLIHTWTTFKYGKSDKEVFPEIKYFDWNCSFEDINTVANAIMKEQIDKQLSPLKKQAVKAAEEAEKEINKEFSKIKDVIKSVAKGVENITSKVHFNVKEQISDIMVEKTNSDGFVHLENQGEGLKRQIWFSLIKSKAENAVNSGSKQFIWAFDEPETHLFPGAQREFFDTLSQISRGNVETIISTHSTVFIDKSRIDRIFSVSQESDGYTAITTCTDVESIYVSLNVKNSDFLFYDKFLIVEGDTEQYLIPRLFQLYTNTTLLDQNIQLVNMSGKDKFQLNKSIIDKIMSGFKKTEDQVVYLFDNDMSFSLGSNARTDNMFFVGTQDIEDAIDSNIWKNLIVHRYGDSISITLEEIESIKNSIAVGTSCASHEKFYSRLKKTLRSKWIQKGYDGDQFVSIPEKGDESADFILSQLKHKDHIPRRIKEAFDNILAK